MTRSGTGEQVATRIGFAEQWLARAKGEVSGGQLARGVLTMVLAQAEVHHAMEMAGAQPSIRRPKAALMAIPIGALAALALLAALHAPLPAAAPAVEAGPPIVRLSAPVGELLQIAIFTPPPPAPAAAGAPARKAGRLAPPRASAAGPARQPVLSAPPAAPTVSPRPQAAGSPPPSVPAAAPPPSALPEGEILSTGDLIDLVVIAGDTLRTDSMRR